MPPGRRKSTQPAASQRTLAFGPHANKVTKPTHDPPSTLKKQSALPPKTRLLTPSPPPSVPEEIKSPESNLTIRESKNKPTVKPPRSEIEELAAKVGEGDVGRYWRGKEAERKAPRGTIYPVYALHFPTMGEPCIGISRHARWKRASKLGLNPPIEVLAVLLKEEAAQNRKLKIAYMDELLDAKVAD